MSGGTACRCPEAEKPLTERAWVVSQRRGNQSAFNGYRWTPSEYSLVYCQKCHAMWRTKARFVDQLKDGSLYT
jgi:hypothetical protein